MRLVSVFSLCRRVLIDDKYWNQVQQLNPPLKYSFGIDVVYFFFFGWLNRAPLIFADSDVKPPPFDETPRRVFTFIDFKTMQRLENIFIHSGRKQ